MYRPDGRLPQLFSHQLNFPPFWHVVFLLSDDFIIFFITIECNYLHLIYMFLSEFTGSYFNAKGILGLREVTSETNLLY